MSLISAPATTELQADRQTELEALSLTAVFCRKYSVTAQNDVRRVHRAILGLLVKNYRNEDAEAASLVKGVLGL